MDFGRTQVPNFCSCKYSSYFILLEHGELLQHFIASAGGYLHILLFKKCIFSTTQINVHFFVYLRDTKVFYLIVHSPNACKRLSRGQAKARDLELYPMWVSGTQLLELLSAAFLGEHQHEAKSEAGVAILIYEHTKKQLIPMSQNVPLIFYSIYITYRIRLGEHFL